MAAALIIERRPCHVCIRTSRQAFLTSTVMTRPPYTMRMATRTDPQVPIPLVLIIYATLVAASACQGAGSIERSDTEAYQRDLPRVESPPAGQAQSRDVGDPSGGEAVYPPASLPRAEGRASWILYPSFADVVAAADLFIVGQVVEVSAGPGAGTTYPLPTTVSRVRIAQVAKGAPPADGSVRVEQTGGVYRPSHAIEDARLSPGPLPSQAPAGASPLDPGTPPQQVLLELEDDPLFRPGERLALALQWVPQRGTYRVVNPQGRFAVDEAGRVAPILRDDPAVQGLAGLAADELLERVRRLAASG